MTSWATDPSPDGSRWLAHEFSELLATAPWSDEPEGETPAFDVVVVGSGYGGAIAADQLAGCVKEDKRESGKEGKEVRVCVLERGREYLPGSFPSRMSDLPGHIRGSFGGRRRGGEGLFDIRAGSDASVVLANGLGGGSLINAGVMEIPKPEIFDSRWPAEFHGGSALDPFYRTARLLLGAATQGNPPASAGLVNNDITQHARVPEGGPDKRRVLSEMVASCGGHATDRAAAITVAMSSKETIGGVKLDACKLCGDCATGCNYNAKESLDTNLLARAVRRGAEIYCGATVLRVLQSKNGVWNLLVTPTDEKMRLREGAPKWLTARYVILAAGALGSTEILLRSQRAPQGPQFSPLLGRHFSTNGDMLCFGYSLRPEAKAVADEDRQPDERHIGPTITGVIDTNIGSGSNRRRIVIEEMAVPGALRRAFEETVTSVNTLHALGELDGKDHECSRPENDPFAVSPRKIAHTSIFAAMGDDGAGGVLRLAEDDCNGADGGDGSIEVVWPGLGQAPIFDEQVDEISRLTKGIRGTEGRVIPNPAWRLLPESMESLLGGQRGPLLTVHPLGGCAMADDATRGVVDPYGRVFAAGAPFGDGEGHLHKGLAVLDGSIVPSALSTNPALTIAALALRAVGRLREKWRWQPPDDCAPVVAPERRRSVGDIAEEIRRRSREPNTVQVTERLAGPAWVTDGVKKNQECWLELTLTYDPLPLRNLFSPDSEGRLDQARLKVQPTNGRLRVFLREEWERLQREARSDREREYLEDQAAQTYEMTGSLTILRREATSAWARTIRALWAWLCNRGLREIALALVGGVLEFVKGAARRIGGLLELVPKRTHPEGIWPRILRFLKALVAWPLKVWDAVKLASHAGEVRLFEYRLRVGPQIPPGAMAPRRPGDPEVPRRFEIEPDCVIGGRLRGRKRITYRRPSNPWRQLQEMALTHCPRLSTTRPIPVLALDPGHFAARGQPLLGLVSQRDHFEALVDVASLGAYFMRMLTSIHIWNARKPDAPRRTPNRLPGPLPGLLEPEIHTLQTDCLDGEPVHIRLTRYRPGCPNPRRAPVVLIHGYSASGTTFAHPSLEPGLADFLVREDARDVWVVDLRSSCGLPTARHPWSMERVALMDIPAAIDHVYWATGQRRVDVVAHCMGAVMFSMAVLSADKHATGDDIWSGKDAGAEDRFRSERRALPDRIHRAVLSQNGPVMVMTPQNTFRAYVMSFLEDVFGKLPYQFRPEEGQGLALDLLDRLLATLPYPDGELERQNSWLGSLRYLGTRHRMDALYGRTFSLKNLSQDVLDHIDDFFGPLSLDTVAQVIHFSQLRTITNRAGRNRFVSRKSLKELWTFPTMSVHGEENGLADIATLYRAKHVFDDAGRKLEIRRIEGFGHQDCLIGTGSKEKVFGDILAFLDASPTAPNPGEARPAVKPPWLGPMLVLGADGKYYVSMGADPLLGRPALLSMLPVRRNAATGRWERNTDVLSQLEMDSRNWPRHTLWTLRPGKETDWFSEELPPWVREHKVEHVAVLLFYPQGKALGIAAFDSSAPVKPLSNLYARPGSAAETAPGSGLEEQITREAIDEALAALDCEHASPKGLLQLAWPDPKQPLRLALGSCQYPPGIVNQESGFASWVQLNRRIDSGDRPDLLVLAGDQVYVDATAGFFDPSLLDDRYRKPHETWLRNGHVRDALRRVPSATMLDDHEIDDNWEPFAESAPRRKTECNVEFHREGTANFQRYQRAEPRGGGALPISFAFAEKGIPIFMLDTRSERQLRRAAAPGAMFGAGQWRALQGWLTRYRERPKIIVTPPLLLPRHRRAVRSDLAFGQSDSGDHASLRSDSWDGYPQTYYSLLKHIADHQIARVVFLSGDEHLGLFTKATLTAPSGQKTTLYSIHSPGLNVPYRFANAYPSDFLLNETFAFGQSSTARYSCTVDTPPDPLDPSRAKLYDKPGFVFVSLDLQKGGACNLVYEFPGEAAVTVSI